MKNLLFTLALLISFGSYAQKFEINDVQVDSGANSVQGTFKIIKPVLIFDVKGTPTELYTKTLNWVEETYTNPDKVLKGKVEGKYIRLNGFVSSLLKLTALGSATYYDVRYTVEIKFKEDKIKYEITNYEQYFKPSKVSSGGWYDASFVFKIAKRKGKPNKKTGVREPGKFIKDEGTNFRSVRSHFESLGVSLNEYLVNYDSATSDDDDDW